MCGGVSHRPFRACTRPSPHGSSRTVSTRLRRRPGGGRRPAGHGTGARPPSSCSWWRGTPQGSLISRTKRRHVAAFPVSENRGTSWARNSPDQFVLRLPDHLRHRRRRLTSSPPRSTLLADGHLRFVRCDWRSVGPAQVALFTQPADVSRRPGRCYLGGVGPFFRAILPSTAKRGLNVNRVLRRGVGVRAVRPLSHSDITTWRQRPLARRQTRRMGAGTDDETGTGHRLRR